MTDPTQTIYDVMVDIETMGTKPGCAILQIGACTFDPEMFHVKHFFQVTISCASLEEDGFTASPSTAAWWANQSHDARMSVFQNPEAATAREAMTLFSAWARDLAGQCSGRWWSQGNFDYPLLDFALRRYSLPVPWDFWMIRDTRTAYNVLGVDRGAIRATKRMSPAHTALGDAVHQVACLKHAYEVGRNRQGKWAS